MSDILSIYDDLTMHHVSLIIAATLLLGVIIQWASWWIKVPAILGLLISGIILGPGTGLLQPNKLFDEELLFSIVSLGVAIVLFEGALTLRFSEIRRHGSVVTNLVTWGALINWLVMGAGFFLVTDLSPTLSLLFAALVVVTGPTVIVPLLRTVRPNQNVSNILRWEGILIDPIGALLAVFMFEFIVGSEIGPLLVFVEALIVGIVIGGIAGVIVGAVLKRRLVPEYLQNMFVLGFVLSCFALSNTMGEEAGLVAVTVMGIYLANTKVDIHELISFKETLSVIIISVLFILLAARIEFDQLKAIAPIALPVLLIVLLARPIMVWATTWRSNLTWQEKAFISWVAPRGIVAAAVSSLFAIKLVDIGVEGAELLPALTFMVIVVTVTIQSVSSRFVARWLGVAEAEPKGVLIVGANPFARLLGKTLKDLGFTVRLASQTWSEIHAAKMDGLDGYLGNPVSTHADLNLDLAGIGFCVALSRRPDLNTLASMKFRNELGHQGVYSLVDDRNLSDARKDRAVTTEHLRVPQLFGNDITLSKLLRLLSAGATIKVTTLTDEFTASEYEEHYGERAIPLLTVDDKKRIHWITDEKVPDLKTGYAIVSLIMTEQQVSA
ncbi:sodium:proton antiporter [bacterium]|nr:sodium:proton antiporter [bacterium]